MFLAMWIELPSAMFEPDVHSPTQLLFMHKWSLLSLLLLLPLRHSSNTVCSIDLAVLRTYACIQAKRQNSMSTNCRLRACSYKQFNRSAVNMPACCAVQAQPLQKARLSPHTQLETRVNANKLTISAALSDKPQLKNASTTTLPKQALCQNVAEYS